VRASEQRLTEHLDDAVLTLAEVLLRRWPAARGVDPTAAAEPGALDEPAAPDQPAEPGEPAEPDEPTWDYTEPEPATPGTAGDVGVGAGADAAPSDDVAGDPSAEPEPAAPSGTHPPVDLTSASLGRPDQGHRRRRGWFRGKD
jgi:hypothetical protein